MKKTCASFILLLVLTSSLQTQANEFLIRLSPKLGVLGAINSNTLQRALKRFTYLAPEIHLEYQMIGHWFASASFNYAYLRGRRADQMNVFAPTAGIKIVSFEDEPLAGDFFDRTRWWFALEAGPYITQSKLNAILARSSQTDFGFNVGAGFDSFFHRHLAVGLEVKTHYVPYSPDDYFLVSFGPHLAFRF